MSFDFNTMESTRVQLMELREARNIRENTNSSLHAELTNHSSSSYPSKLHCSTRRGVGRRLEHYGGRSSQHCSGTASHEINRIYTGLKRFSLYLYHLELNLNINSRKFFLYSIQLSIHSHLSIGLKHGGRLSLGAISKCPAMQESCLCGKFKMYFIGAGLG